MTASYIYPLWYYALGVLTTVLINKALKKKSNSLNEIERIERIVIW